MDIFMDAIDNLQFNCDDLRDAWFDPVVRESHYMTLQEHYYREALSNYVTLCHRGSVVDYLTSCLHETSNHMR